MRYNVNCDTNLYMHTLYHHSSVKNEAEHKKNRAHECGNNDPAHNSYTQPVRYSSFFVEFNQIHFHLFLVNICILQYTYRT